VARLRICDIIKTDGLPYGVNSFGYTIDCLREVFKRKILPVDTNWGRFFENPRFSILKILAHEDHICDAKMSLDYQEDFEFFKEVIEKLYKKDKYMSLEAVINYIKNKPNIKVKL